jgi:hypothetical protein
VGTISIRTDRVAFIASRLAPTGFVFARIRANNTKPVGVSLLAIGRTTVPIRKNPLKVNPFLTGLSFIPRC